MLAEIIAKQKQSGKAIVACAFNSQSGEQIAGPPAYFARELFAELLALSGDSGARKVVLADASRVTTVDFPAGAVDLDTRADYEKVTALRRSTFFK